MKFSYFYKLFMKQYISIILLCVSCAVYSQTAEIGLFGGGSYYLGDINPGKPFSQIQPAFGFIGRYNFDTRWAIKTNVLLGTLKSDDATTGYNKERNSKFNTSITEATVQMEVNFLDYFTGSTRTYFTPYLFGGASYFITNDVSSVGIPFGLGLKYSISKRVGFGAEWGIRKTFTDDIDGLGATYPDGQQLSNSKNNDWYSFAGVAITYKFKIQGRTRCLGSDNAYKQ